METPKHELKKVVDCLVSLNIFTSSTDVCLFNITQKWDRATFIIINIPSLATRLNRLVKSKIICLLNVVPTFENIQISQYKISKQILHYTVEPYTFQLSKTYEAHDEQLFYDMMYF